MKFSIIMPVYNREKLIARAIDSVLAQTCGDWELVIVDDGSTDGTVAAVQGFRDERIKLVCSHHKGVSKARNAGLATATGDWIAYLDSDNVLRPQFLSEFATAIASYPSADAFYCRLRTVNGGVVRGRAFDWELLRCANYIDMGTYVHRRELYHEFGGFNEHLQRLVDWELILRYSKRKSPVFIKRVLMDYNDSREIARITADRDRDGRWQRQVYEIHAPEKVGIRLGLFARIVLRVRINGFWGTVRRVLSPKAF